MQSLLFPDIDLLLEASSRLSRQSIMAQKSKQQHREPARCTKNNPTAHSECAMDVPRQPMQPIPLRPWVQKQFRARLTFWHAYLHQILFSISTRLTFERS